MERQKNGPAGGTGLEAAAGQLADGIFRTTLDRPGFAHLLPGNFASAREFRGFLVSLGDELARVYRERSGRSLGWFSLGRFDQQVTTEAHRDGAPEASVLLLGYEPTSVVSRLFLIDSTRAALDRDLTPTEFLDRFNPLRGEGRAILGAYTTELTGLDPGQFQVVAINNSVLPWELRERGMLGVLHRAWIPQPDPSAPRWVNSLILSGQEEGQAPRIAREAVRDFVEKGIAALG
jgi:hypothetical protein